MYPFTKTLKFFGFVFAVYLPLSVGRFYYTTNSIVGYFENSVAPELILASLSFIVINAAVFFIKSLTQSKKKQR